jgi:tRNA 2-thiouridine synthesizing protein C
MKKLLFVQTKAPHGTLFGHEGLDAILMGTAFVECTVLLLEDGVFQVLKGQDPSGLGTKDYSVTYKALRDYGVDTIYCSASHLSERGLIEDDLLVPVQALTDAEVTQLIGNHDVILSF